MKRYIHCADEIVSSAFIYLDAKDEYIKKQSNHIIQCALSTRDLTSKLVRTKSSNIWAYGIDVNDDDNRLGDLLIQFKGKNGGPDDIYIYYDVPTKLYKRFVSTSSKGHFFWRYIRNNYKYTKLTGDKKGKLPNAINQ